MNLLVNSNAKRIPLADGVEIYQGDCMEIMPKLTHIQFDLGWADPPYNIGKKYDGYNDSMNDKDYMEWVGRWFNELQYRCRNIAIYPPKTKLLEYWNLMPHKHLIICAWSPFGAIRGNFIHQYIPLLVPSKPVTRVKDCWWNVQVSGLGYFYREKKYDHPGQTSLDITQRIIKAFTWPGDWVLDPFGGTGTTAEACIKLGRKCILIEQSKKYVDIAVKRIKRVLD